MNEVRNLSFSYNTQALHRLTLYPAVCCAENPDTLNHFYELFLLIISMNYVYELFLPEPFRQTFR